MMVDGDDIFAGLGFNIEPADRVQETTALFWALIDAASGAVLATNIEEKKEDND